MKTMGNIILVAMAVGAMAQCGAIDLAKENWKVPNWNIIITEHGTGAGFAKFIER